MVQQRRATQKIPLEPWEVGGELLDILSRGLYSDAKDAIREYAQNGVDARASRIVVTVSGPVTTIRDDGSGMDWDALRRARRLGMSEKSPKLTVGYRGIGLYASFGMCETLTITTRQAGMDQLLHANFEFGPMRRILEQDRASDKRTGIALADLLYEYTEFRREPYGGDQSDHFTLVRLDGVIPEYRAQLNDVGALNTYLLNALPVAFPDRGYGPLVNQWLREHVGLNPVGIVLRVADEPQFEVEPPVAEGVEAPEHYWLADAEGRQLAFIWHSLSTSGARIESNGSDEGAGISGFLLKRRGFTLGNRVRLKPLWPPVGGRTLYHHYTGEVHVLDNAGVYPNAARDDLEASPERQVLTRYLHDYFGDLNRKADLTRDIIKTARRMQGLENAVADLKGQQDSPDADQFELYWSSRNLLETLDRTERELLRLRRGRKAVKPTAHQQRELDSLSTALKGASREVAAIVQASGRRTKAGTRATAARGPKRELPPQAALLARAVDAVKAMHNKAATPALAAALEGLEAAAKQHLVPRAVALLDDLRASGLTLSDDVEGCRKELRTFLGWSAVAPVSLEQALIEEGISLATDREESLVRGIDKGLVRGVGGRGEAYESILRAIAESLSEEQELQ